MSNDIKEKLESYQKKSATPLEKEVLSLVFESSESYIEFKNFLKHFAEHSLDSGLIPKLTSNSFCIEFTDRYYMEIESLLTQYELDHGKPYVHPEETLTKVSLAYFGFSKTFQTILSKIQENKEEEKDSRIEKRRKIEAEIRHFTGTDKWHKMYPNVLITDGVKFVFDLAESYWLGEIVFSLQTLEKVKAEPFQLYELEVNLEKHNADLKVTDGNENVLYTQFIEFTDFPLPKFSFYYTDSVILLSSEY